MRRILLAVVVLALILAGPAAAAYPGFSALTTFTLNSTETLTNYQVSLLLSNVSGTNAANLIYTGGLTNATWNDVIFTDTSDNLLPFWREAGSENSTTTRFWVNVSSISASNTTQIRCQYGNTSTQNNLGNPEQTFLFFDDFSAGSLNPTKWRETGGSGSISFNGTEYIVFSSSDSTNYKHAVTHFYTPANNTIFESRIRYLTSGGSVFGAAIGLFDTNSTYLISASNLHTLFLDKGSSTIDHQSRSGGSWGGEDTVYGSIPEDTWLILHHRLEPASASYKVYSDRRASLLGSALSNTDAPIGIGGRYFAFVGARQGTVEFDWVISRKYAAYEPTTSGYYGPPLATFTSNVTTGADPLAVQINDTSSNTPTAWGWNATNSDNSTTIEFSTAQNPVQTFDTGHWQVTLIASNALGWDQSDPIWINVSSEAPPLAMFMKNYGIVIFPVPIQFTDASSNTPTAWNWSFGDGRYSNDQNPLHQYVKRGRWTVLLNTSNAAGYTTNTSTVWILGG